VQLFQMIQKYQILLKMKTDILTLCCSIGPCILHNAIPAVWHVIY